MLGVIPTVDTEIDPAGFPALDLTETLLHLKSHSTLDNGLVASWITAATTYFEEQTGHQLISARRELWLDAFPTARKIEIPRPALQDVEAVEYQDATGTWLSFGDGASPEVPSWTFSTPAGIPARRGWVELKPGFAWPATPDLSSCVRIRYVCGYGDTHAAVPDLAKTVLRHLVQHFDRNRSAVVDKAMHELPFSVDAIVKLFKYRALPTLLPRNDVWP